MLWISRIMLLVHVLNFLPIARVLPYLVLSFPTIIGTLSRVFVEALLNDPVKNWGWGQGGIWESFFTEITKKNNRCHEVLTHILVDTRLWFTPRSGQVFIFMISRASEMIKPFFDLHAPPYRKTIKQQPYNFLRRIHSFSNKWNPIFQNCPTNIIGQNANSSSAGYIEKP